MAPFVANMGMEWPTFNDFPHVWRPTWQWWTENGDNIKTKVLEILHDPNTWRTIGIIAVIIALSLVAIPLLLCLVHVIGFGVIGPVAGSIAACIQGVVYGGATMGIFSVVQAFAMTTSVHPLGPILAIGLLVFVIWLIHQAGSGT